MNNNSLILKNNRTYDVLKYVVQIVLPALATLYFALSQIWGFPNGEQVLGTIVAITTFLGVSLGVSSSQYYNSGVRYDGEMVVVSSPERDSFSLSLNDDPENLKSKDEIIFKVNTLSES